MILTAYERALLSTRAHPPTTDHSQLAKLLQPFWNAALAWVPRSVAPNTLTVAGSLAVVVPTLLTLTRSPDLTTHLPAWLISLQILGVFLFQTLDALDGKQARRLGVSSPLGSWLDHALDIITMQLVLIGGCASMQAGLGVGTWALLAGTLFSNYLLHWESSHTNALILGNGTSITEAQVMVMATHAACLISPGLFSRPLGSLLPMLLGSPLSEAPLSAGFLVASVAIVGGAASLASVRRALASAVPRAESARRLLNLLLVLGPASCAWFSLPEGSSRLLLGCAALVVAARSVGRLVLENLLHRAPATLDLPSFLVCLGSLGVLLMPSLARPMALPALIGAGLSLLAFFVVTARGLASPLGERIFSLERVTPDDLSRADPS